MITDSSRPASQTQMKMLERPLKYAPVTFQNCRPQFVKRAMSTSTTRVAAAV